MLDTPERSVALAEGNDLLGHLPPDVRQLLKLFNCRGVDIDSIARRGSPGPLVFDTRRACGKKDGEQDWYRAIHRFLGDFRLAWREILTQSHDDRKERPGLSPVAQRSFVDVLQVVVSLLKDGPGAGRAVHFAYVALADHGVEDSGGTSVADAKVAL